MTADTEFDNFVRRATGHLPYRYQRRLAAEGLPELLRVPTGTGKTLAATLPWLFRRLAHPDLHVRASTPRWLAFVLPMRVLVEQTRDSIRGWLTALGLDGAVGLHVVMGGEGKVDSLWRLHPEREAIFVGTLDMLVSRALNRGYGENRFRWPIDFGLFNAGVQWVFDEVQLMGPALPTSRQLEGLRRSLGTALPCRSMWMSATVEDRWLATVDMPGVSRVVGLDESDRAGELVQKLEARKAVARLHLPPDPKDYPQAAAERLLGEHRPGTLTIAVFNVVERAREVYLAALKSATARGGASELVLLHSRFRPDDRARHLRRALAAVDPAGPGRIVISTQVLEAGVDISATTLFTEAAPWPSVVQRAGRCNRYGEVSEARLLWASPPRPAPYEPQDVEASAAALEGLEGQTVHSETLGGLKVAVEEVIHPILRRTDLIGLFDTAPDLSGNDLDVSRFIRQASDMDLQVAWRPIPKEGPGDQDPPTRAELCPVPIGELRSFLKKGRTAWRFDHLAEGWVRCQESDVRPGMVLLLPAQEGGYEPQTGWNPASKSDVATVAADEPSPVAAAEEGMGDEPLSRTPGRWVPLLEHLADVERAVREMAGALRPPGLSPEHLEAVAVAARLHDVGKAHPVFQATLFRSASGDEERAMVESGAPWAKSSRRAGRHERRNFRHELASALALLDGSGEALAGLGEPDLALYLVGAHHGRVRLAIRSLPNETRPEGKSDRRVALGIHDGESLPPVAYPGGGLPATVLDLSVMEAGEASGRPSWTGRMLALRDRADLGPFRLALLEALIVLADWRASAAEEEVNR